MSLVLSINKMDEFYAMTDFARKPYYNQLDFQCSPWGLTLTVSRPSPEGRCFVELQLGTQFFPHYAISSGHYLHGAISLQQFFTTFLQKKQSGFDFFIFTLIHGLLALKLSFLALSVPHRPPREVYVPFLSPYPDLAHNRTALSTTLVIFHIFTLQSMLATFNDPHVTFTVTLTSFQAKFTGKDMGIDVEFPLSVQRRECVVQGVAEGEEAQFEILLNPIESFNNIVSLSNPINLVVIAKAINNRGVIIISTGLYTQYVSYSSDQ